MEILKSSLSLETHLRKKNLTNQTNLTNQRSIICLLSSSSRRQRISGRTKRLTLPLGAPWKNGMFFDTGTDGDIKPTRPDINYQSPPLPNTNRYSLFS